MRKVLLLSSIFVMAICFYSCGDSDEPQTPKPELKIEKSSYTLNPDDVTQISFTGDEELLNELEWDSDNEFVATIDKGLIYTEKVGKATITSSSGHIIHVEVSPNYNVYEEPSVDFGASMSTIKAKYGTPYSSSSDALIYKTNNSSAPYVMYVFTDGKLYFSSVILKNSTSVMADVTEFLLERYIVLSVDEDDLTVILCHCKGKKNSPTINYGVGLYLYYDALKCPVVFYLPYTESKSRTATPLIDANEYLLKMGKCLKNLPLE